MHRIDNATSANLLPTPEPVGPNPDGYFQNQTIVGRDWMNAVQEELCSVIEAAGLTLDKANPNQLMAAMSLLGLGDASTIFKGIVELATNAETQTGTDTVRAVTPAGLASLYTAANVLAKLLTVDGSGSGLDADLLDGSQSSDTFSASTIAKRNASGHLLASYFQTTANFTTLLATAVMIETGSDGFLRRQTPAQFIANHDIATLQRIAALSVAHWIKQSSAVDINWESVCWSPALGLFCAVASNGTGNGVMTSSDGYLWTARTPAANNSWISVCWSPERALFCAVAYSGTGNRVMTSPDGINWTIRTSAADNSWTSVCWSSALGLFVAVAASGTGNRVMTSPDGINWTIRTSAADNTWNSVCWSPELRLFVAVAGSGGVSSANRVMTSPDGINWTIRYTPPANTWNSVCWSAERGLFCSVASSGTGDRAMITVNYS